MLPIVFSFGDALDDLAYFAREAEISASDRSLRSAIRRAYREVTATDNWSCLQTNGRITLVAAQSDGTVAYTESSGALVLTGSTWPADAVNWSVQIETEEGEVLCDVAARVSDTQLTLDSVLNPGRNLPAGSDYVIFPRFYRLPNDFICTTQPVDEAFLGVGQYILPEQMLQLMHELSVAEDQVRYYTIMPVPRLYGAFGLFLDSYFTEQRTVDFIYKRLPRDLRYAGKDPSESPGTISVSSGNPAVIGSSTAFTPNHVGALLRIGDSNNYPSGLDGLHPYVEQRSIVAYTSTAAVTLDAGPQAAASTAHYSITDPMDVDAIVYDVVLAFAKTYLAAEKNNRQWKELKEQAAQTLFRAKCADCRVEQRRFAIPGRARSGGPLQYPASMKAPYP